MSSRRALRRATLGRLWRLHRLGVLVLLALAALALGLIGFLQLHQSPLDALYNTLSLLAFNYNGPEDGAPWTLEIARFMAPAATAFATFTALTRLMDEQWTLVRAGRRHGHIVICGLGQRGAHLVRSYLAGGNLVTAVEADRANPQIEATRRLGALVIFGDASDQEVLRRARAGRAAQLIAVCTHDATNAAIASQTRVLAAEAKGQVAAFCHVTNPDLVDHLTAVALSSTDNRFSLEWFSVPERAARLLVHDHAGLGFAARAGRAPRLAVVGTDYLAGSIVLSAVRTWTALSDNPSSRIEITVAAPDATRWTTALHERFPALAIVCDLRPFESSLRAPSAGAAAAFGDAAAIFVCERSDTESLEAGFAVARLAGNQRNVVIRLLVESEGFANLLEGAALGSNIRLFSVVERTCSAEMVTEGIQETLAQALHATYLEHEATAPSRDLTRPAQPWEALDETYKRSNRNQARHIAAKLSEARCGIRPLTDWHQPLLELSADEVERLAELEHERWKTERLAQGWQPGKKTVREQKTHEYINVPWSDLPEDVRELDRLFVRALPRTLAGAGYELYRLS